MNAPNRVYRLALFTLGGGASEFLAPSFVFGIVEAGNRRQSSNGSFCCLPLGSFFNLGIFHISAHPPHRITMAHWKVYDDLLD
jgi:hypothetical protein